MHKFGILFILLIGVLFAQKIETKDPFKAIDYFVLENGLQVYILTNPKTTNTIVSMNINVGWEIEEDSDAGISHLVEHLVFRDKRIPHRDYLDYFKEQGASYVNGFTRRYETGFTATIDSNKSYWLTENFAKMLFDKEVDNEDLDAEKGAVQVEIGENHWYTQTLMQVSQIAKIFPKEQSVYNTHFKLDKAKDLSPRSMQKSNNETFTLEKVMAHYHRYYYPANMTLKVVGNFDNAKMKSLIIKHYAKIKSTGTARTHRPKHNAVVPQKPYRYIKNFTHKNNGYIGTMYVADNYQKYIIMRSFVTFLSNKIQQKLRNKNGKSYTVSTYTNLYRAASIVSVSFDGLHDDFENNIALVQKSIDYYVTHLDDTMIQKALEEYAKKYTSLEYDSDSLTFLVDGLEFIKNDYHSKDQNPYSLFASITPQEYKKVVTESFVPEKAYTVLYRDYLWFNGESILLGMIILILIFGIYFKFSHILFRFRGEPYHARDILLKRRVSNRLIGVWVFIYISAFSTLLYVWLERMVSQYVMDDKGYVYTLEGMEFVVYLVLSTFLSLLFMLIILRWASKYYSHMTMTEHKLYLLGNNPISLSKEAIQSMEVVSRKDVKYQAIYGFAFFFWRPLLAIETEEKTYYLRSHNAQALKEDMLKRWGGLS